MDLRRVEAGAFLVVFLRVESVAGTVLNPSAAPFTLIRAGSGDRLNRQALGVRVGAVAADPGQTGINHEADARHSQGGFGDIGREDDPSSRTGSEDALLVRIGQSSVERQDLAVATMCAFQQARQFMNIALGGGRNVRMSPTRFSPIISPIVRAAISM